MELKQPVVLAEIDFEFPQKSKVMAGFGSVGSSNLSCMKPI